MAVTDTIKHSKAAGPTGMRLNETGDLTTADHSYIVLVVGMIYIIHIHGTKFEVQYSVITCTVPQKKRPPKAKEGTLLTRPKTIYQSG